MDDLNATVAPYVGIAIVALAVACVLLLVAVLAAGPPHGRLGRRIAAITRGSEGQPGVDPRRPPRQGLRASARDLDELRRADGGGRGARSGGRSSGSASSASTRSRTPAATRASRSRSSTRSGNGFVVSSLHSRTGTRVYAQGDHGRARRDGAVRRGGGGACAWPSRSGAGGGEGRLTRVRGRDTQAGTGARHRGGVAPRTTVPALDRSGRRRVRRPPAHDPARDARRAVAAGADPRLGRRSRRSRPPTDDGADRRRGAPRRAQRGAAPGGHARRRAAARRRRRRAPARRRSSRGGSRG